MIIQVIYFEAIVFGGEDCIELFDENEKSALVFFYGDEGAELLNAIAIRFVHRKPAAIKASAPGIGMFDTEQRGNVPE